MTTPLVVPSLAVLAHCPTCNQPVYLGACDEKRAEIYTPLDAAARRWWECQHLAPDRGGAHCWWSLGPIEIRPVRSIHVDVL